MVRLCLGICVISILGLALGCAGRSGGGGSRGSNGGQRGSGAAQEGYELDDVMALYADSFDSLLQEFGVEEATLVVGYKLAHMVEWPENAFKTPQSPFVVGIGSDSPLLAVAREILVSKEFRGHPIEINPYESAAQCSFCHMVFVGQTEDRVAGELAGRQRQMLTIATDAATAGRGLMLCVSVENERLRLRADETALKNSDLVVDEKLLEIGR